MLLAGGVGTGAGFSVFCCTTSRVPTTPTSAAATQLAATSHGETPRDLRTRPPEGTADTPSGDEPRTSEDSEMVCRKYSSGRRFDMRSCYAVTPAPGTMPSGRELNFGTARPRGNAVAGGTPPARLPGVLGDATQGAARFSTTMRHLFWSAARAGRDSPTHRVAHPPPTGGLDPVPGTRSRYDRDSQRPGGEW